MPSARISQHAVQRYTDRVDRATSPAVARLRIAQILALGRWRPSPRHWMSGASRRPGTRFVYWAELPSVCVIVVEGTAVTLVTRELTRGPRMRPPGSHAGAARSRRQRLQPVERWRWYGDAEETA
jgi:hypothetical protein